MTSTPYASALAALGTILIPGVRRHYPASALPGILTRAGLPALVLLPGEGEDAAPPFARRGEAFETLALSGRPREATAHALHLLLIARETQGAGRTYALGQLAALTDAYLNALAADPLLSGCLVRPTTFTVEQGVFGYGGRRYYGCRFRHTWLLRIGDVVL